MPTCNDQSIFEPIDGSVPCNISQPAADQNLADFIYFLVFDFGRFNPPYMVRHKINSM